MSKHILLISLLFVGVFSFGFDSVQDSTSKEMIYDMPENMPQYPGGGAALDRFIQANIKYPAEAKSQGIQGKVYVQFIVEKDGTLTDIQVRKGVHKALDAEAVRVVSIMPNWSPGTVRGKKVRVRYTLPITFHLR